MSDLNDLVRRLKGAESVLSDWGKKVLQYASIRIGKEATATYMRNAGKNAGPRSRSDTGPLRIVSGRLAKSLTQPAERNPDAIEKIEVLSPTAFQLTKGSRVEYAATHEFGDVRTVTARQRAFFWYKFDDTGDERWRAFALSDELTYPARPYLRPGLRDAGPMIERRAVKELEEAFERLADN